MDTVTVESLIRRVERVERENHWLKILCLVPLVVLGTVVLLGATRAEKEEVRDKIQARKFVVVDKDNKERGILGVHDKWGTVSLSFYANNPPDEDSGLEPFPSLLLATNPEGNPRLAFWDKHRKNRAWLHTTNDGGAIFCLGVDCAGGQDKAVVTIDAHPSGSSLTLYDVDKTPRAILGSASLEATRTGVTEKRPESSFVFFDKKGKTIWKAP